ncbi:MAG: hypothetical protein AAGJ35_15580, partial [Myxococcota bacterium]
MVCMDEQLPVLHGLGFVENDDLVRSNVDIESYYALHWNGDRKPWEWRLAIDAYAPYFLKHAPGISQTFTQERAKVKAKADARKEAKTNSFLVWTAPRSGSEWFMSILDRHPNICASGETQSSGRGWPREALLLREATEWADVCQPKAVCHWSITARLLEGLLQESSDGLPEICYSGQNSNASYYGSHLTTICGLLNRALSTAESKDQVMQTAFHYFLAHVLNGERPGDLEDVELPCSCPLHTTVTGLKVMGGWLRPQGVYDKGGYNLTGVISQLGSKLIILDRMNLVSSYISLRIGQTLGSFHCSGKNCKHDLRVNVQVDRLVQFLKQTIAQRIARNAMLE